MNAYVRASVGMFVYVTEKGGKGETCLNMAGEGGGVPAVQQQGPAGHDAEQVCGWVSVSVTERHRGMLNR